ncbi:Solute carrier family 2 [Phytophthora citrophthora]|uniref:Hexose transporter 1 n=1 Tax=Phytophthora citrophthora TaxID=4793 RepID=A0AAD9GKN4_9STRA|nr:Solute carrier family 2 [Phytophthora citrophthora]
MQHSQSDVALGTNGSWADLKIAEGLKKRSNTAQNLQFYVEEQKRLYQELPFSVLPGMRRQSFQRERSFSNLKSRSSWGSFTNLVARAGEEQPLLGADDEFPEPGYTFPLLLSCGVALMSAFQFGYNTGVTGGINPDIIFPGHSDMQWAICVSIFAVGGPIGSLTAGQVSTALGRKKALLVDSFLFIIAGAIMALSVNIYALILGRFLVGFASGTVSVVVPLYLGELAPPNLRGALGTGYQLFMVMGILAADLLAFKYSGESQGIAQPGWRLLFGFTAVPGILQLALASLLTESPRWLLTKNRPKEAADILRRLRGSNDVYEEIDSICSASDNESGANTGIWDVLRDRSIRFPLVAAVVLQVAQQFSGINAVMFYASSFFKNVGLKDPLVGATLVYTVNVISTGVALVLMDTAGRRPLLIYSAIGMIFSSIVLTLGLMNALPFASMASVGGVMCFVWFFEIGLGPIPWLIVAEMFPAKPRPTAMSIATMVNWSCSFLVGLTFPTMQRELGEYTFVPFCIALCMALAFTLKYIPETKGKTIQEIQAELHLKQQKSMEI